MHVTREKTGKRQWWALTHRLIQKDRFRPDTALIMYVLAREGGGEGSGNTVHFVNYDRAMCMIHRSFCSP